MSYNWDKMILSGSTPAYQAHHPEFNPQFRRVKKRENERKTG
jgi:hypothetical protein